MGADLLHQFALAAMPEIIRAHPGYAAKTVAVEADVAGNESTVNAIGRGCRESNSLYGSSPGRAQLYAVDAVVWGAYLWAANRPGWRMEWFGYVYAAVNGAQAVSNYRTEC